MGESDTVAGEFAGEPPIQAVAVVELRRSESVFQLCLPNGKRTHGHVPRSLREAILPLAPGDQVKVEISPYDFERARITLRMDAAGALRDEAAAGTSG